MKRISAERALLSLLTFFMCLANVSCNIVEDLIKASMTPYEVCLELYTEGEETWWSNDSGSFVVYMPGNTGNFGLIFVKEGTIQFPPSLDSEDENSAYFYYLDGPFHRHGDTFGKAGGSFEILSVKNGELDVVSLYLGCIYQGETIARYENVKLHKVNVKDESFTGEVYAHCGFKGEFAERSFEVKGVTADGASQLAYYYTNDEYWDLKFTPYVNGELCEFGKSGEMGSFSQPVYLPELNMWRFYYTAPYYYGDETLSICMKAVHKDGDEVTFITYDFPELALWKPGVALVHGLNADFLSCWGDFGYYLTNSCGYMSDQIEYVDYESTNKASFSVNTFEKQVIAKNLEELYTKMLSGRKVLSSKYTLIGHSMGGILSRLYAQEISTDGVGAIITVNTPHWGSRIADLGKIFAESCEILKEKIQPKNHVTAITRIALEVLVAMYNSDQFGALEDLSASSDGIAMLNGPKMSRLEGIPVHAYCSDMEGFVYDDSDPVNEIIRIDVGDALSRTIPMVSFLKAMPKEKYDDMFVHDFKSGEAVEFALDGIQGDDRHDGVVAFSSQKGGLDENSPYVTLSTAPYKGKFIVAGLGSDAFHCNVTKWSTTYSVLTDLLNEPYYNSSKFCYDGFKAPEGFFTRAADPLTGEEVEFFMAENESTSVTIDDCYESEEDDIRVLDIVTSRSEDIIANMAVITYTYNGETEYGIGACNEHFRFEIPEDFAGEVDIYIFGKTENNELTAANHKITL